MKGNRAAAAKDPFTSPMPAVTSDAPTEVIGTGTGKGGNWDWREHTIGFPAIRDEEPEPAPATECTCGMPSCPDSGTPQMGILDIRLTLSCAEGVTSRMYRRRLANGELEDIDTIADEGDFRIHRPALARNRQIRNDLAACRHDIAAQFGRDEKALEALSDVVLRKDLLDIGARMEELGEQMHREALERLEKAQQETAERLALVRSSDEPWRLP